jgi:hypothetical protein
VEAEGAKAKIPRLYGGKFKLVRFRRGVVMASNSVPSLPERVGKAFEVLSRTASELNKISDELGKSISEIDAALKKLNLGVEVWVQVSMAGDGDDYYIEKIGYAKVSGVWGLALRTEFGYEDQHCDDEVSTWLFGDGPRALRLDSIAKLPDLLEELSKIAVLTTERIRNGMFEAQMIAGAVTGAMKNAAVAAKSATLTFSPTGGDAAKGGKK